MKQGSTEWHEIRKGKLTASHGQEIATNGVGLKTYVSDIILYSFIEKEFYTNNDIERGNELEPIAAIAYEMNNFIELHKVGFIQRGEYVGMSPDGLIMNGDGIEGGIEVKAKNNKNHYKALLDNFIDSKTLWQIHMSIHISGAKFWDFCSYNPNFTNSLVQIRVERDEEKCKKIENGLKSGIELLKLGFSNEKIKTEIKNKKICIG